MSTCAGCGLPKYDWRKAAQGDLTPSPTCDAAEGMVDGALVACRDRQIAAQAALLRSVTTKLEEAAELLEPPGDLRYAAAARELVVGVLEVLS